MSQGNSECIFGGLNMENPRAGVSAVDCMIDRIIEGKTIASVPHHSDMWNVAS
jgi:hypothetical protein